MSLGRLLLSLTMAGLLGAACGTGDEDVAESDGLQLGTGSDSAIDVPKAGTVLVELSQPTLVQALEREGFHFAKHFGVSSALANDTLLERAPLYRFIADDFAADLDVQRARVPRVSTQVANGVTRILDKGWLRVDYARFELVGVVNRLDRLSMSGATTCGEVRFLYRLAYSKPRTNAAEVSYSRLPVVANVVYDVPRDDASKLDECRTIANAWVMPRGIANDRDYVAYLTEQVLPLEKLRFKQLELNAQVLRVPSESKTDMGGLAEYAFRIYGYEGGIAKHLPLENTPDIERLEKDPALKEELATYLREHVSEIDQGAIVIPSKFTATKVSAFSTFGSARLVNKPFTRLFYDAATRAAPALEATDLSRTTYVANVAGLLARLDDLSCTGCHQGGRSVAGFHFLGEDSLAKSHPLNVARVGKSPHFLEEEVRRKVFIKELANGGTPSGFRNASFAPARGTGTTRTAPRGAPCLVDASAGAFQQPFRCAQGLTCTPLTTNPNLPVELGQCLPATSGPGPQSTYEDEFAGLPCLSGKLTDDLGDPRRDKLSTTQFACKDGDQGYTCRPPSIGVPGGLCTRLCASDNVPYDREHELCAYAGGKEFDLCAGKNDFATCLAGVIKSGLREACDENEPCREDYICQKFIKVRTAPPVAPDDGRGYCVPTYFLFGVRADGHPNPTPQ